jgi:Kef-type K+ transport system membrane component KefB
MAAIASSTAESGTGSTMFYAVMLLLGCIVKEINKHTNFPMWLGQLLGGFILGYLSGGSILLSSWQPNFADFSRNVVFALLFPGGNFLAGYLADFHVFRKEMWRTILLSSFGVWINLYFVKKILELID